MSEIWGIILAAGESKRMGRQKLLLPFQGKTIIEKTVENALNSRIDHVLIVLGSHSAEIFDQVRHLPVRFSFNKDFRDGMLSSVKCGVKALPENCQAVLIFPGDQPMIEAEVINKVIEAYRSTGYGIVIPSFENKKGHPVLIDHKYLKEIEDIKNTEGLRSLAIQFNQDVLIVETDCKGILKDIDTPEEYLQAIEIDITT
jgi:molybdenum cofactor cytidylyltransferase